MNRRALLQCSAALAAAGSVAGCLAGGVGTGGDGTTTMRSTTTRTTTDATTTRTAKQPEEPFETVHVGSREGVLDPENNRPHSVRVTNRADETRTIRVQVRSTGDSPTLERWSWELPPRGWVRITLLTPAAYTVTVSVDGERAGDVTVARSWFDCNASWTNVTVTADGSLASRTLSTAVACASAVRDGSVRVTDSRCASESDAAAATLTFAASSVRVTGSIRVPSPSYGVEIAGVEWSYGDDGAALTVTVAATEPDGDDVGAECVGMLDYEATLTFENGVPDRVTVEHRSMGETTAVTTAGRGTMSALGGE